MSNPASKIESIPPSLLHGRYKTLALPISTRWEKVYIAEDLYRGGFPKRLIQEIQLISNDGEFLQAVKHLFNREVQILKTLGEDNRIPQLIDYLEIDRKFYLVQDFTAGETLKKELYRDRPWSQERVIAMLEEVLPIIELVHSHGIIHGNIQPEKLIRREADSKLVLTGLSVLNQMRTEIIAFQGQIRSKAGMGKIGYISVEQMRGILRPGSDIYALGAIAIEALTGFNPLQLEENRETGELRWRHLATVTEDFAGIIEGMVRYHFRDRYHSAADILADLKSLREPRTAEAKKEDKPLNAIPLNPPTNSTKPKHHAIGKTAATIATSFALGAGGYFLLSSHYNPSDRGLSTLAQANQKYQEGNLPEAVKIAQSIKPDNPAYQEAQTAINEWTEDWQKAQRQFQSIQTAFNENQWSEVLNLAPLIPHIAFWQEKVTPIANQAQANLDKEAYQRLKQAYNSAITKDFTTALSHLKQIPTQTKIYPKVQTKIAEYTQKESIKAQYLLQEAYTLAAQSDFTGALEYLKQIPQDTPTYSKAQEKIAEYTEKSRILAQRLSQRVSQRVNAEDLTTAMPKAGKAIAYLSEIPEKTPANRTSLDPSSYLQEINPSEIGQVGNY